MKPLLHPFFILLLLVIISTKNIPTCLCDDDEHYTNCNRTFSCGGSTVSNLKYPFWGGNRDQYCGQPQLTLTCEDRYPKITINSIKYRILLWNDTAQILNVARDDYWNGVCVNDYKNTTLENTPFQYQNSAGLANLTLFYNCPSPPPNLPNTPVSNTCGDKIVYFYVGQPNPVPCTIVVIPIFGTSARLVSGTGVNQALNEGFGLGWTGNYGDCNTCISSGGECGFEGEFKCFCKNGTSSTSCYDIGFFFSFLIITFILDQIPTSCCADDVHYQTCSSSFHCANLKSLSYPFWGSNRPEYCGHPAFKLDCTGKVATFTIMSQTYQLLEVSDSSPTLKVARNDYYNNTCPTILRNTTIGCTLFSYGSDSRNLTLYYDCPSLPFPQPDSFSPQFNCSVNGTQMINYFVMESFIENAESSFSEIFGTCNSRVIVPILESEAKVIETNSTAENLKAALDSGFDVEWDANNTLCDECQNSGGHCGYSPISGEFTCYCRDGSFPSSCKSGE
ncbi:hypothetical protein RJT34_18678 [Clitoria ternatea]|uniref:non-specific serine/threonine protein kinase n=1 Tax=Clitoria ternatea TaxID=43366 RepID=A0AAN9JCK5_CLITE